MAMVALTLGSLMDLDDGRVALAFLKEAQRAVADCEDRPGDKTTRKVLLQMEITPVVADGGLLDGVHVGFQVNGKLPTKKSKLYTMSARRGGHLMFSSENAEDFRQKSLLDGEGGE